MFNLTTVDRAITIHQKETGRIIGVSSVGDNFLIYSENGITYLNVREEPGEEVTPFTMTVGSSEKLPFTVWNIPDIEEYSDCVEITIEGVICDVLTSIVLLLDFISMEITIVDWNHTPPGRLLSEPSAASLPGANIAKYGVVEMSSSEFVSCHFRLNNEDGSLLYTRHIKAENIGKIEARALLDLLYGDKPLFGVDLSGTAELKDLNRAKLLPDAPETPRSIKFGGFEVVSNNDVASRSRVIPLLQYFLMKRDYDEPCTVQYHGALLTITDTWADTAVLMKGQWLSQTFVYNLVRKAARPGDSIVPDLTGVQPNSDIHVTTNGLPAPVVNYRVVSPDDGSHCSLADYMNNCAGRGHPAIVVYDGVIATAVPGVTKAPGELVDRHDDYQIHESDTFSLISGIPKGSEGVLTAHLTRNETTEKEDPVSTTPEDTMETRYTDSYAAPSTLMDVAVRLMSEDNPLVFVLFRNHLQTIKPFDQHGGPVDYKISSQIFGYQQFRFLSLTHTSTNPIQILAAIDDIPVVLSGALDEEQKTLTFTGFRNPSDAELANESYHDRAIEMPCDNSPEHDDRFINNQALYSVSVLVTNMSRTVDAELRLESTPSSVESPGEYRFSSRFK